ncbi:MAG: translation initiation factor IF-2 [Kiritimatiellae bacterium]|nr:translation initiation factor IF-2 [Kiritimatiellia bacterium]
MRVYELAKEFGVTSEAVIKAANARGIDIANAIASISKFDMPQLREAFSTVAPSDLEAKRAAKKAKAKELFASVVENEKASLERHLAAAKAAEEGNANREKLPRRAKAPVQNNVPAAESVAPTPISAPPPPAPVAEKPAAPAPEPIKLAPLHINPKKPQKAPMAQPKFSISVSNGANAPSSATKPLIRMAPGVKPKPGMQGQMPRPQNAHPGFKPLQKSAPAGATAIKITVAAQPKVRPPKEVGDYDDIEIGNRKGKKGKDALKAFEKLRNRNISSSASSASVASRISLDESSKEISIRGAVVVKDLATKLGIKPNRLIADLMALKILASINQRVEPDIATKVAEKYGFKVTVEKARDKAAAKPVLKAIDADDLIPEDPPETLKPRAPVVTFLGHVDHGKTTLMDWIRKEHVAAGEAGGITQQISAYQVEIAGRKITFLDTPGHAAFSAMRARGAQLTDIAVLIIAADDGIMPQTEECIKVARQAGVQIMVAITKADKPTANVDKVKQQLQKRGLTPEDWGGDIICTAVSGVTGMGVDSLLENILVQAEVLELVANPDRRANGYVIESELQQGLGPCATLLVSGGTLKVGDAILIGEHFGKVRALIDDRGRRIKEAPPSTPVKATGLSGVPEAGAEFRVMLDEKRARTLAEQTAQERKEQELSNSKAASLDALMSRMAAEGKRELNVIVKSDTQGSLEAIVEALRGIKSEKVGLNVIGTGTGNVSLTDVKSAAAGKAVIAGFDISNDSGVQQQARHDGVRINSFRIIYELIDYVKQCMLDLLPPEYKEVIKGHAEIKAIYDIGKLGKIAGSQMLDGSLVAKERFRILRGKATVWDGKVQTLRHFKDEVKEVSGQQECGVCFQNFEEFKEGDVIECYMLEELPRTL